MDTPDREEVRVRAESSRMGRQRRGHRVQVRCAAARSGCRGHHAAGRAGFPAVIPSLSCREPRRRCLLNRHYRSWQPPEAPTGSPPLHVPPAFFHCWPTTCFSFMVNVRHLSQHHILFFFKFSTQMFLRMASLLPVGPSCDYGSYSVDRYGCGHFVAY